MARALKHPTALMAVLLAVVTLAVYWPVTGYDFVNLDDPRYVTENKHVQAGITWAGLGWALRETAAANWHPVTLFSHMLDCQLYGLRAAGHHVTNLLLHAANTCLLFALLLRMTGRRWPSFVVAGLFGWHPLHVESVAWIAERKDVLSMLLGLLALWAYVRYVEVLSLKSQVLSPRSAVRGPQSTVRGPQSTVQSPQSAVHSPQSTDDAPRSALHGSRFTVHVSRFYVLSLLCFAVGLMAKPMLVTLPFVMLLLDYWPLRRCAECRVRSAEPAGLADRGYRAVWARLVVEKLPFIMLSFLSCAVTLWAQGREHAIITVQRMPMNYRAANAVLACYAYVGKTLWPTRLAVFYPHGHATVTWPILLAGAGLVLVSAAVLWLRRSPCLAVGWLWFMGTLVPVIGLVQVGEQAMADRYTYIPSIGLFILIVFGLNDLAGRTRQSEAAMTVLASLALVACVITTRQQLGYWRNSEALYRHALAVTEGNYIADNNLAVDLFSRDHAEEAVGFYLAALRYAPNYADAHSNLGNTYAKLKRRREAIAEYRVALKLDPNLARTHYYLANELLGDGDADGAEAHYQASLALDPDRPDAHYQLATVLHARGDEGAAIRHFHQALRLKPDWIEALNNLAWLLATQPDARFRDGKEALELASRAVALTNTNNAGLLDTMGGALAEVGRFTEAANTARTAAHLAQDAGAADLAREITAHLQCYERGVPIRESGTATNAPANPSGRPRADVGPAS